MRRTSLRWVIPCAALLFLAPLGGAQEAGSLLVRIKAVGKEGAGGDLGGWQIPDTTQARLGVLHVAQLNGHGRGF